MNPLLTKLKEAGIGYRFSNNKDIHIPNIAYVDDLTLIMDNEKDMEKLIKITEEFFNKSGLMLNMSKSTYIAKKVDGTKIQPLKINNWEIKATSGIYMGILTHFYLSLT